MKLYSSYTNHYDSLQKGFNYLLETREEKLFINMQHRLQQANINDRERRLLLSQLESRAESQKALVMISLCEIKILLAFTTNQNAAQINTVVSTKIQKTSIKVSFIVNHIAT